MSLNALPGTIPTWTTADRFRKAREERRLTQTEFAEQTGLSRRTIGSIETGEKVPTTKDYNLWQMITGVPRAWLETGESSPSGDGGGKGEGPRSGVQGPSLPGLDSNQEPAGFTPRLLRAA